MKTQILTGWRAAGLAALVCSSPSTEPTAIAAPFASTWPQEYSVTQDNAARLLTLTTPYYTIQHDLRRGGAISLVRLTHGRAPNLLVTPLGTRVRDEAAYSDLNDPAPRVRHSRDGLTEIVAVESRLMDGRGREAPGLRLSTRFEYHWGYIKIHKEYVLCGKPVRVRELSPVTTVLAPDLSDYGYREGTTEQEGAPAFSFGSCRWGKLKTPGDAVVRLAFMPRYVMFAAPGVEGLEWFAGSDLWQWDLQLTGKRGQGQFLLERSQEPEGTGFSISPLVLSGGVWLTNSCSFDYYLGLPLLEGHARQPWFHTSFSRNKGAWVGTDQARRWAESGIQTVHCHNDGDAYDDGLFWRDGSYPPYPDMSEYDKVIRNCHDDADVRDGEFCRQCRRQRMGLWKMERERAGA